MKNLKTNPISNSDRPADSATFSYPTPLRRDKRGNPIARRQVYFAPITTLDPDALIKAATEAANSPELGLAALVEAKVVNAVLAKENAVQVEESIHRHIEYKNALAEEKIEALEPQLETAEEVETEARAASAEACARAGIVFRPDSPSIEFTDSEPWSLNEIAGRESVATPKSKPGLWSQLWWKLLAAVGGGAVFGVGLGALVAGVNVRALGEEPVDAAFWIAVGIVVMSIVGVGISKLAEHLGAHLVRRGHKFAWIGWANLACAATFLAGLALALVRIESKVEQLGLFKSINAEKTMTGTVLAQADLFWVSLMLVVPIIAAYLINGLAEGERLATMDYLLSLRKAMREKITGCDAYAFALSAHERLRLAATRKGRIAAEIEKYKAMIRHDRTQQELDRIEDAQNAAAGASYEAVEYVEAICGVRQFTRRRKGFWQRLREFFT